MAIIISAMVKKLNGKTLVLFTSYKTLRDIYHLIKNQLKDFPINVYAQNIHGSRESIIERFKKDKGQAVILGVDSFWEGVDIQGEALSCVILQKLPFPVPTEPLHFARVKQKENNDQNSFLEYTLPLTILKFKQGLGRLIRSKTDTGYLLVLDNRLLKKSYGQLFLKEMEKYTIQKAPKSQIGVREKLPEEIKHDYFK